MSHFPRTDIPDLTLSEIQAVLNQTALAVAERFGEGVGFRNVMPLEPVTPEDAQQRLENAHLLAGQLHERYCADSSHHFLAMMFGAPVNSLKAPEFGRMLSARQQTLVQALERFAQMKRVHAVTAMQMSIPREPLTLNNVEVAEIAVFRCELETHLNENWRHLPLVDRHDYERLEIALAIAPLLDDATAIDFAMEYYDEQIASIQKASRV